MKALLNYDIVLRLIIYMVIFSNVINNANRGNQVFLFVLLGLLITVDLWRRLRILSSRKRSFSLVASFVLVTLLSYYVPITSIYLIVLLWDVVLAFLPTFPTMLMVVCLGLDYFLFWAYHNGEIGEVLTKEFWITRGSDIMIVIGSIVLSFLVVYYVRFQMQKRLEVQQINQRLEEANAQLEAYAKEIEGLAVTRERNRLAQEIHDSLGHSLAGLIMHLDYIEKVMEDDSNKARELIVKSQRLARQGMGNLRQAVKALQENPTEGGFAESINRLIDNIQSEHHLHIELNLMPDVEAISPELKSLLYQNIQEGLTNALKHGQSSKIQISVAVKDQRLVCTITDNGRGCRELVRGTGLTGMEERLHSFGGEMRWKSGLNQGFTLTMTLPIEEGAYGKD